MHRAQGGFSASTAYRSRAVSGATSRFATRLLIFAAISVLSTPAIQAGQLQGIVNFDASLSDTGNAFFLTGNPQAPNFQGRASNGLLWIEHLANLIGIPTPVANLLGGKNYAVSGSNLGPSWPGMGGQIDTYLSEYTPDNSELFILYGGSNDFNEGERDPTVTVGKLVDHITTLANAGASEFMVANLAPLEHLPFPGLEGSQLQVEAAAFSQGHNALLATELPLLETALGIEIFLVDQHRVFSDIIANPATHGFVNGLDNAYDPVSGVVVPNPNEYLWWDYIHPTTAGHAALAAEAFSVLQSNQILVPEPSSAALVGTLLLTLFACTRRRRPRGTR